MVRDEDLAAKRRSALGGFGTQAYSQLRRYVYMDSSQYEFSWLQYRCRVVQSCIPYDYQDDAKQNKVTKK